MEVRLAGAVLSGIARDVATCGMGDCDGLIWGRWDVPRTISRPQDYSQPGASASTRPAGDARAAGRALVQAHTCSGALFGFYDHAATIDVDKLSAEIRRMHTRGVELLGWWVGRRNARLRPSARDATVHAALCNALADGAAKLAWSGRERRTEVPGQADVAAPLAGAPVPRLAEARCAVVARHRVREGRVPAVHRLDPHASDRFDALSTAAVTVP